MSTWNVGWVLSPWQWAAIALAILLSLSGCATSAVLTPSPLRAARFTGEIGLGNFSDMSVILFASETLDAWEQTSTTNEILALAGAGTMGGLATGAFASPPAAQGLLLGANSVLMLLNLWRPVERSGAYNQGRSWMAIAKCRPIGSRQPAPCCLPRSIAPSKS